jgi:hypothetical protein
MARMANDCGTIVAKTTIHYARDTGFVGLAHGVPLERSLVPGWRESAPGALPRAVGCEVPRTRCAAILNSFGPS